jgi:DNA-binding transcriptional LysR family regulator
MLYDRALSLVEFVEQTAIEVGSFNFEGRGTINLGCISSCANMLLSFVKNDFSKKYPNTMIKVSEKNTYELIKLLSANLIEGAIMRTPFDIDSAYKKVTILRDQIVAIGSRKIFETCKNEITIDELVDYPLITYRRWEALFTDIFRKMNYVPNYYCINDDARTSLEWAMANLGIALVPQSITAHLTGDEEIIIKPIQEDTLKTEVCFVWNAETYTSAPMKCFIESLFHYYCIIEETLDQ